VAEHYALDHMQTQWQKLFDGGYMNHPPAHILQAQNAI